MKNILALLVSLIAIQICNMKFAHTVKMKNFTKSKGELNMRRKIITITKNMIFQEIENFENYIWKNNKLIPIEMIEGE